MRDAITIASEIQQALEQRQWKRALSILEQGIGTLARTAPKSPHNSADDNLALELLNISVRTLETLQNKGGISKIGELRQLIREGKLRLIDDIGVASEVEICNALAECRPRRNKFKGPIR